MSTAPHNTCTLVFPALFLHILARVKTHAWLVALLAGAALNSAGRAADFAPLLQDGSNVWSRQQQQWLTGGTAGWFRPVSAETHAELRYPGYKNSPKLEFLGHTLYEVVLSFGTNGLAQIVMSTYNRGDAGDLSEAQFAAHLAALDKSLTGWAGAEGKLRPAEKMSASATINSKLWAGKSPAIELKWSTSKHAGTAQDAKGFRAEYVKLILAPLDANNKGPAAGKAAAASQAATAMGSRRNVRKADAFVFIDNIPMVDQGQKGYCAVATAERILRYYGKNLDQHVLAQMADTQTGGGTSPDAMFEVFRRIGLKLGLKVDVHYDCSVHQVLEMVGKYNQQAKKDKTAPVDLGKGGMIDIAAVYQAMDPATLRRSRCERQQTAYRKFVADIASCVDQGIPVAWGVMLGIVAEKPELPQAVGGHIRIIFGYNKTSRELLYTDSWGMGHERKTMTVDDAWVITTGLFSLDPRH